jgi:AcrR family transcriptional regulator
MQQPPSASNTVREYLREVSNRQALRQKLSRDLVIETALRITDSDGLAALTMRSLAAELGVAAPTLYWYFDSRAELIAAISGKLLAELPEVQEPSDDWLATIRTTLLALWELAERHPAFLEVVGVRPLHSPEGTRLLGGLLTTLRHAGHDPKDAVRLARSFLWLAFGLIRSSEATAARQPGSAGAVLVDPTNPVAASLVECAPFLRDLDPGEVYRTTIELALSGVASPSRG